MMDGVQVGVQHIWNKFLCIHYTVISATGQSATDMRTSIKFV